MIHSSPVIGIRRRTINGKTYVDYYAYCGRNGSKRFFFFGKDADAVAERAMEFIAEYKETGGPFFLELSRRQRLDAVNAYELAAYRGLKLSLSEIVSDYLRLRKDAPACPEIDLIKLFEIFCDHIDPVCVRNLKSYRVLLRLFASGLKNGCMASSVTKGDIERFLCRYKNPTTYNSNLKRLKSVFTWAVKKRLLDVSPASDATCRLEIFTEPTFFGPAKVEKIFRILEEDKPGADIGMYFSLGFFAGIRSAEITRAKWEDINLDEGFIRIPVPKGLTNGGKPRLVDLEPNAVAWMKRFMSEAPNRAGLIIEHPYRVKEWKRVHLKPEGLSWGNDRYHNVMRHTYATMHVAAFRDAAATALNLGHGSSTTMLESHYKGLARRAEAESYWTIAPLRV